MKKTSGAVVEEAFIFDRVHLACCVVYLCTLGGAVLRGHLGGGRGGSWERERGTGSEGERLRSTKKFHPLLKMEVRQASDIQVDVTLIVIVRMDSKSLGGIWSCEIDIPQP